MNWCFWEHLVLCKISILDTYCGLHKMGGKPATGLSSTESRVSTMQRAASGRNGWKLSEEGSGLGLNLSPRMGAGEPLSTARGRCQSHGTGSLPSLVSSSLPWVWYPCENSHQGLWVTLGSQWWRQPTAPSKLPLFLTSLKETWDSWRQGGKEGCHHVGIVPVLAL